MSEKLVIDSLIDDIRREAARRRLSKRDLARAADLHVNTLQRFDDISWSPSIETIRKLERALFASREPAELGESSTS